MFGGKIDLSDVAHEPGDNQRSHFLTRALAAFSVASLTGADPEDVARSITDGFNDGGMDAIYFDDSEKTLYIAQAKWSKNATKTIEEGDVCKFTNGVEALMSASFAGFNDKIRKREQEIWTNLLERSDVRIVLLVAYTGPQELPSPQKKALNDFLEKHNIVGEIGGQEIFVLEVLNLKRIYQYLTGSAGGNKIKLTIALKEWGAMNKPYSAVYGSMALSDIATWAEHGKPLLARNIRFFRGMTEVNEAIQKSVLHTPERFWYFNNGITILCDKIQKTMLNGDGRDYGVFVCEGASIVNGAQTVGVVWDLEKKDPLLLQTAPAHIYVRLISLEHCPEDFETEVTRATNTQNRIQSQDFAALDREQERLARDMLLDGLRYSYKSGDAPKPKNGDGCTIEEATIALACASNDVGTVVLAKRNLGMLWQDIHNPPYTTLFNSSLSAPKMWRAVLVMREVSKRLAEMKSSNRKGNLLTIHGNRFILHRVFRDPVVKRFGDVSLPIEQALEAAQSATDAVVPALRKLIEEKYPNAYLAVLFKNTKKCKDLDRHLENPDKAKDPEPETPPAPKGPQSLFDHLSDPPTSSKN